MWLFRIIILHLQREEVEGITLLTGEATKRRSNTSDNRRKRRTLRVTLFFRLLAIIGALQTIKGKELVLTHKLWEWEHKIYHVI